MNDKLVAGIVAAVAIAPICALCVLGPAFLGSIIGAGFGWITDLGPVMTTGLAIVGAILVYGFLSRKKRAPTLASRGTGDARSWPDCDSSVDDFRPGSKEIGT